MADRALKNIFASKVPVTRPVTIRKRISKGKYEVEDSAGRLLVATAVEDSFYPPGAAVVIQDAQITGARRMLGTMRRVEV